MNHDFRCPWDADEFNPISSRSGRWLRFAVMLASLAFLASCGQIITPTPTPTPPPTATVAIAAVATLPPTSTPAPYTPAPTPTPTVTPTPVIYQIQPGDSLLAIAQRYGLTVASLQDANGILDPRTLQVGQQLIIPSPEEVEDDLSNATPTPTPLPITVQNVYFSQTNIGGLWVLGEVANDSGSAVEQVRVAVVLLDDADEEIGRAASLVSLDLVDVGQRAPFAILFGEVPGRFARYQAFPISAVPAYVGSYYRDLTVEEIKTKGERYASYSVEGVVRNTGPEEAVSVQVVLTAYDSLDRVIAMRQIVPEHNVVPRGGETTFNAILAPIGGPVSRVEAVAQGRRLSAMSNQ
ncbi:MAG: FxLYD domain-containing protein [Caldilineaceae bacterium]|nr:FxLYD domain-containing protein [Caldilineaceae bacterium]